MGRIRDDAVLDRADGWPLRRAVAAVGENLVVLFPLVGVASFGYIALALFLAALEGIYTAALYRYASVGDAGMMDSRVVEQAFRAK